MRVRTSYYGLSQNERNAARNAGQEHLHCARLMSVGKANYCALRKSTCPKIESRYSPSTRMLCHITSCSELASIYRAWYLYKTRIRDYQRAIIRAAYVLSISKKRLATERQLSTQREIIGSQNNYPFLAAFRWYSIVIGKPPAAVVHKFSLFIVIFTLVSSEKCPMRFRVKMKSNKMTYRRSNVAV